MKCTTGAALAAGTRATLAVRAKTAKRNFVLVICKSPGSWNVWRGEPRGSIAVHGRCKPMNAKRSELSGLVSDVLETALGVGVDFVTTNHLRESLWRKRVSAD